MQGLNALSCPRCGSELTAGVAEGLCPKCLLDPHLSTDHSNPHPPAEPPVAVTGPERAAGGESTLGAHSEVVGTSRRYVRKAFHARGGMGEVWLSEDSLIGREVAVKVLRHGGDGAHGRFATEVRTAGRLEHPGIVPVHDVGSDEGGRPFYVMKFVRGRTLKTAILEHHSPPAACNAGAAEVRRVGLLKTFIDLCNAVGYAHSRGVLHRDIKPDNVMLGPFGETLLLDWGLAKVMGQEDAGDGSSGFRARGSGDSSRTGAGTVMGTPTYMAPEMAGGRAEDVDQRTDVYLLGATLYEIVTGQVPRRGNSRDEMIELARSAPPPTPRKLSKLCPRPLDAVVMKAMALRKEDRYPGAVELAEDVQRYLAGEPVSACREPLPQRLGRWCRRHRRGIVRSAAVVIVAAAALSGAAAYRRAEEGRRWAEAQRLELAERERARRDVEEVLRLSDEAKYLAANSDAAGEPAPYYDPETALAAADAALAVADAWGRGLERLPLPREREQVKRELYELILMTAQARARQSSAGLSQPDRLGRDTLMPLDRAAALVERPTRPFYRLRAMAYRAAGDEQRAMADEKRAEDPAAPLTAAEWYLSAEKHRMGSPARPDEADRPQREEALQQAVAAYREALRLEPDHFWSRFQLGRCYLALDRRAEAIEALGACIALRPESPWGYSARGLALARDRRFSEAEGDLAHAMKLAPDFRAALLNRGVVNWMQRRHEQALRDFTAAVAAPQARSLAEAAYYRGLLLAERGDLAGAAADFDAALLRRPRFRAACEARARVRLMTGDSRRCLEDLAAAATASAEQPAAGAAGAADDARVLERRARMLRVMASTLPRARAAAALELARVDLEEAVRARGRTASLCTELAQVLKAARRPEEALGWCSSAVEAAPADARVRVNRGHCHYALGRYADAQADFEEAVRLDPGDAEARAMLGYVLACQKRDKDALREAAHALLASGRGDYLNLHNVACVFAELSRSDAAGQKANQDVVVALLRQAVALWRKSGYGPSEVELIRAEPAFRVPSLQSRDDFRRLTEDDSHGESPQGV